MLQGEVVSLIGSAGRIDLNTEQMCLKASQPAVDGGAGLR